MTLSQAKLSKPNLPLMRSFRSSTLMVHPQWTIAGRLLQERGGSDPTSVFYAPLYLLFDSAILQQCYWYNTLIIGLQFTRRWKAKYLNDYDDSKLGFASNLQWPYIFLISFLHVDLKSHACQFEFFDFTERLQWPSRTAQNSKKVVGWYKRDCNKVIVSGSNKYYTKIRVWVQKILFTGKFSFRGWSPIQIIRLKEEILFYKSE